MAARYLARQHPLLVGRLVLRRFGRRHAAAVLRGFAAMSPVGSALAFGVECDP